ncbi:two pore domain potassium channel family protein [Candidatus Micrarchaeota archaeon]|nr:two pore domain potassium channel family protein [Candidatus Micrarchaeota archaeon]
MGVVLLFGVFFIILQTRTADSGLRVAIGTDALSERDAFYFSAVTYFTVGYGDIVPYGYAKLLSVVEAGIGTVINLIILAMAVTRVRDHEGH